MRNMEIVTTKIETIKRFIKLISLAELLRSFLVYSLFLLLVSFIAVYFLQLPYDYWKFAFALLLSSILFFLMTNVRVKKNAALLQTKGAEKKAVKLLIKSLPAKENLLVYNELVQGKPVNPIEKLALSQLSRFFSSHDFAKIFAKEKFLRKLLAKVSLVLGLLTVNLLLLFSNGKITHFWLHPFQEYIEIAPFEFVDMVKRDYVFEGDSVQFAVKLKGETAEYVWLEIIGPNGESITVKQLNKKDSLYYSPEIDINSDVLYRYGAVLPGIASRGKNYYSEKFILKFLRFPKISNLQFEVIPPQYTGLFPAIYPEDYVNIDLYAGSVMKIKGFVDQKPDSLKITMNGKNKVVKIFPGGEFHLQKKVYRAGELSFSMTVYDSLKIKHPVEYKINLLKDEAPAITLLTPQRTVELPSSMNLNVKLQINDDFGFSKLMMIKKRYGEGVDTIRQEIDISDWLIGESYQSIRQNISFANDYLLPDEKTDIYFVVYDNNQINGPKFAATKTFSVTLPSFEKLLNKMDDQFSNMEYSGKNLVKETAELREKINKLNKDIKKSENSDWNEIKRLKEGINTAQNIEQNLQKMDEELSKSLQMMKENNLLSPETLKKYNNLREMLQKIMNSDFPNLMKKLQQLMEKNRRNALKKTMDEAEFSLKEFEEQIERIYELFKKVEIERKLDEMLAISRSVEEKLQNLKNHPSRELAKHGKEIEHEEEYLEKSIEKTKDELENRESDLKRELGEIEEFHKRQEIAKNLGKLVNNIANGENLQYNTEERKLTLSLQKRTAMLAEMKREFVDREKNKTIDKLNYIIDGLFSVCNDQEKLNIALKQSNRYSVKIPLLAVTQQEIRKSYGIQVRELIRLSKETFFLPMTINRPLALAGAKMEEIRRALEQRQNYLLAGAGEKAYINLNKVLFLLISTRSDIKRSGSGTGIEKFMQNLEQLAQRQSGINGRTMELYMQQQGRGKMPGADMRKAYEGLAEEQREIEKGLNAISGQLGPGDGRLQEQIENMKKEMADIAEKLRIGKPDKKLLERQEKLLSRMLDTGRSLKTKNDSDKRIAERAKQYKIKIPGGKPVMIDNNKIFKEYQKMLKSKISPEYKLMLKEYYENLLKKGDNETAH